MISNKETLLNKMFPGGKKLPPFSDLKGANFIEKFSELDELLDKFVTDEGDNLEILNINDVIRGLKKNNSNLVLNFVQGALDFYFSHPKVLGIIQEGRETLFPNRRSLPDIDFDLLIPVFERD